MDKITIYQFTDPTCIWCWGNEPVLRAIDYLYGDKIGVEFIMGGLVEDAATLIDSEGTPEERIAQVAERFSRSWAAAAQRHGMPVRTEPFTLFSPTQQSSFPQNIAYEAAKRLDPAAAKRFLRRLREATFAEARPTAQIDVLVELAAESGLDAAKFVDEYTRDDAQGDFTQDRNRCRSNGITGFPSYLIKSEQTSIVLGGFQNLATFHTIIRRLSDGKIKPRKLTPSKASVTEFIKRYGIVYPVEIETAFGLDRAQTDAIVDELLSDKRISAHAVGEGRRLTDNSAAAGRSDKTSAAGSAKATATKTAATAKTSTKPKTAPDRPVCKAEKPTKKSAAAKARPSSRTAKRTEKSEKADIPVTTEA